MPQDLSVRGCSGVFVLVFCREVIAFAMHLDRKEPVFGAPSERQEPVAETAEHTIEVGGPPPADERPRPTRRRPGRWRRRLLAWFVRLLLIGIVVGACVFAYRLYVGTMVQLEEIEPVAGAGTEDDPSLYSRPDPANRGPMGITQLRWCFREMVRVETLRQFAGTAPEQSSLANMDLVRQGLCDTSASVVDLVAQAQADVAARHEVIAAASREHMHELLEEANAQEWDGVEFTTEIQRLLDAAGYDVGGIDGILGGKTRESIKAFQLDNNLPIDGKATFALRESLRGLKSANGVLK